MRGTVPSMVPDMCDTDLHWTPEQEGDFNSAARLNGEKIKIIITT